MSSNENVLRLSNEESNKLTKECLKTAMISLMSQKEFDKISITELVNRSGVSRMAFYRNYKCKEDIIADIRRELSDAIKSDLLKIKNSSNIMNVYMEFLREIKENSHLFGLIINAKMSLNHIFENINVLNDFLSPENPREKYSIAAYEGAVISVIKKWFTEGMNESIEEIAEICTEITETAASFFKSNK